MTAQGADLELGVNCPAADGCICALCPAEEQEI